MVESLSQHHFTPSPAFVTYFPELGHTHMGCIPENMPVQAPPHPNPHAGTHSQVSADRWLPFLPCSLSFLLVPFLFVFPLPSWALGHHRTGLSLDGFQPLAYMAEALPWLMALVKRPRLVPPTYLGHSALETPFTLHLRVILSCAFSLLSSSQLLLLILPCVS